MEGISLQTELCSPKQARLMSAAHVESYIECVIAEGDEDETPVSRGVCLQNDESLETGAQTNPSLFQSGPFCSDQGPDTHPCHTLNQLERNLRREETHFREDVPQRTAEGSSSCCSKLEGDLSQKSALLICDKEKEGQVDENGPSKTFIGCSEGLTHYNQFVSGRNTSTRIVTFEEHDYVGADLSAVLPAADRVSQEPAEGDNEADAFRVIDPVIWSQIGREAEWLLCSSDGNAGGELSLSVQVCEVETSPEVRTSQDSSSDWTGQLQDQRTPLTHSEPLASSAASDKMQEQTDGEGGHHWEPGPAGDDGVCGSAGPNLSICSTVQQLGPSAEEAAGIQQLHLPKGRESDELRDCICDQRGGDNETKCDDDDDEQRKKLGEDWRADILLMEGEEEKCEQEVKTGGDINADERETAETRREFWEDEQKQGWVKEDVSQASPREDASEWMENTSSFCDEDPEQRLGCLAHDPDTPDIPTLCAVPPASDAVVPCQSLNAHHGSTSLSNLTYFPSAFSSYNPGLGGWDTFEKVQLSPDDDDDDGGPGIMPVFTRQLLKPPQEQGEPRIQATGSEINKRTLEEEEEEDEGPVCNTDNMESGLVSGDSCCDVQSFMSAADVSACTQLEEEPSCGSASPAVPAECPHLSSDLSGFDFEMREQFGRVLQELSLFFDISRNEFISDCRTSSPKPCSHLPESLEDDTVKPSEQLSRPGLGPYAHTSTEETVEEHSLVTCGVNPEVSCPVIRSDGEQEVPLIRNMGQEPVMDYEEKNKESRQAAEPKGPIWSPSFSFLHLEQLRQRAPEAARRLEPLKTCSRPIRVGLSKRAKTKQLHHFHPYK
ncbi:uncharacterized protein LOC119798905 [Cyprinodon tularosa]|uniref:uncharacterized protein LOC119798905 n=1 Tax=Cyprinodon tularosa TaxID=77115 RepID=UPI0018E1DCED|nr:uncharacterized protein LOC119798905 [Cyprinodon tularosa]